MPSSVQNVVLIRHDVSIANVDPMVYRTMPDHVIPLVSLDSDRVKRAGSIIAGLGFELSNTCAWSSPYVRCLQTQQGVLSAAYATQIDAVRRRESFLLREQEFGDWDSLTDAEAEVQLPRAFAKRKLLTDNQGKFYFRYPNGESRADVVQRVISFIGKIIRSDYSNHILFLHGVTQRAFRMAWLNLDVDWFEDEPNPKNASVLWIRRDSDGVGWIEQELPDGECRSHEWRKPV
ncbi:MAG: histidine phosphatase family protein [Polyangiaceae bacterium]